MHGDKMFIETEKYSVSYNPGDGSSGKIVVKSKSAGRHSAEHTHVNVLDREGRFVGRRQLDETLARIVLRQFSSKGDTGAFAIFSEDIDGKNELGSSAFQVSPESVLHVKTEEENAYTANGSKLWYHKPIFDKLRETGFGSIVRATMTNHQVCASKCQFCSTIARNRRDSITLEEAIAFVDALYFDQAEYNRAYHPDWNEKYKEITGSDIRLKGLILSGGGQPNLWPHFEKFVEYLSGLDIDLGLITNGFPKHVKEDIYTKFKWIRVSITPEAASPFYPQGRFDLQYLPDVIKNNSNLTVGYSYVFGPWTNDDVLMRINNSIKENGFDYCRMLTDCNLTREMQLAAHADLAETLRRLQFIDGLGRPTGKIFHQLKYHGTKEWADEIWDSGQCYLQAYNVFWDTTGHELNGRSHCYPCDSVTVLTETDENGVVLNSERKFNHEKWGTVTNDNISDLYRKPLKPYFDPRSTCSSCLFMKNNETVKNLFKIEDGKDPSYEGYRNVKHVNFP